ncbi:NAD(P)/FAD-dependent oxidoreductase [Streptomyces sp. SCSIO ZS0520]|uniref:NAD(P)/FAD-dependent oxidoreductase n=1 Tax=Streptomyces sp. SCSIO ZS0520 TaxID=2892996 RepID=UPI0021DAB9F3|nr:NAD(P)/FAD-dependent oxidoreductase [Streptomyces sp. SCSIO ZS0520]
MSSPPHDVVVIGAGAAGLTASVMLARAKLRVLVVSTENRRNSCVDAVHNVPYAEGVSPAQLYGSMEATAEEYGVDFVWDEVLEAEAGDAGVAVRTRGGGRHTADRLLLATGPIDELPSWLPEGVWGKTAFECPFCHTHEHDGKPFASVGTGLEAIGMALMSIQYATTMTAVVSDESAAGTPMAERLRQAGGTVLVDEITGADRDAGGSMTLHTKGGAEVAAGALLIPGVKKHNLRFVPQLGLELNQNGGISTTTLGQTANPRVWCAGNGSGNGPYFMWTGAAASGINAARSICEDIAFGPLLDSYWTQVKKTPGEQGQKA